MHLHAERVPKKGALHLLPLDAKSRECRVAAVALKIGDEVLDDRRWNDVPDVLCVLMLHTTTNHLNIPQINPTQAGQESTQ